MHHQEGPGRASEQILLIGLEILGLIIFADRIGNNQSAKNVTGSGKNDLIGMIRFIFFMSRYFIYVLISDQDMSGHLFTLNIL
jgi:hypothetical protein